MPKLKWELLGGSWVAISGVISPLIWVIIIATLIITPLITAHEPPSRGSRRSNSKLSWFCASDFCVVCGC